MNYSYSYMFRPYRVNNRLFFCKLNQLGAQFFLVCLFPFVHVSDDYVPIIRRNNCIYAILGTCFSVGIPAWMALVIVVCCQKTLRRADPSSRGVIPSVVGVCQ